MSQLPPSKNTWTAGTVLATASSLLSLIAIVGSVFWYSSRIDLVTSQVPIIKSKQEVIEQSLAVLQTDMRYNNVRYAEIQLQLAKINDKLDAARVRNGQ